MSNHTGTIEILGETFFGGKYEMPKLAQEEENSNKPVVLKNLGLVTESLSKTA